MEPLYGQYTKDLERRRQEHIKALCQDHEEKKALAADLSVERLNTLTPKGQARMCYVLTFITEQNSYDPSELCANWRNALLDPEDGTSAFTLFNAAMKYIERSHGLVRLNSPPSEQE